jgi:signal transduction histidine kinase
LKPFASIALIVAALAVILGLAVASARREARRLVDEFTATTMQRADATVEVLSARLDALDQDTRILTDVVERARRSSEPERSPDPDLERRMAASAFNALAMAVAHYRIIALVHPEVSPGPTGAGERDIVAVEPTEVPSIVEALLPQMRTLARDVTTKHAKVLGEPTRQGTRSFLLYGTPVGTSAAGRGAIVIASDAARFLSAGSWAPLPTARMFVTDPAGVVWVGCETAGGCRATDTEAIRHHQTEPAIQVGRQVSRPTGAWTVTWVASTRPILERERWLVARIAMAALAAALVVAAVGLQLLRQQRQAVALEGELRYARALANTRDLENQLVRAEKLMTVGVLSTEIAHEIGSPLAVIRGRAEQVLREVPAGPRAEDLRVIIKHIDSVASTIRQLLDFSRRPRNERRPIAIELVVERARDLLQWKLAGRKQELVVTIPPGLPTLSADPDQLQQVLVNLLLNACDASEPGRRVTLAATAAGEEAVKLEIGDEGSGIAPEHMEAVFDPFFTTKQRGEGTGLGLPIAASIVRNHGGQLSLRSVPGKGTTATVLWPTRADAALGQPPVAPEARPNG